MTFLPDLQKYVGCHVAGLLVIRDEFINECDKFRLVLKEQTLQRL